MTQNNIVIFPKDYNGPKNDITPEEVNISSDMIKHYHVQETINAILPILLNQLSIAGFDSYEEESSDEQLKKRTFLVESLRSLLLDHYGIYHPFQTLSEAVFESQLEDDEIIFNINKNVNVSLVKEEIVKG